ncbi:MAG: hypothetical protein JNK57_08000 [Planctomycetaceae bacterium]|nr:hypothetical protein [Planctomycetaceae bacterium]
MIRLLRQISTCRSMREQIVASALAALGEDSQKVQEEAGLVRQRISAVQSEINNLVGVLAKIGAEAAALGEHWGTLGTHNLCGNTGDRQLFS